MIEVYMDNIPAFYDDHFHALRAAIESGRGYKETAHHLWPSMKSESAYARLKKCCQEGDNKLDLAEVLAVCRFNERFDPVYFLCGETMHEIPRRKQAEEVAKTLAEGLAATMEDANRGIARLEALVRANPHLLKSVA